MHAVKKAGIKSTKNDQLFDIVCNTFLIFFIILIIYPLYFILVASFTSPEYVNNGRLLLYPVKLTLEGYKKVLSDTKVWIGYGNTIIYATGAALLGTTTSLMSGYALSRKDLPCRNLIMKICVFTMYFGGGTIPTFLVIKTLHLLNTRAIMIILAGVSVYNMIVVRSFIQGNIPEELYEAAEIDGCGHGRFFLQIVIPLSKAVAAVIMLWIVVGQWNSYFGAMLYLTDANKYPLQLYLRQVLLQNSTTSMDAELMRTDPEAAMELKKMASVLKYSFIVIATAPVLCAYPFVQKYFVKGVLIGSIKG